MNTRRALLSVIFFLSLANSALAFGQITTQRGFEKPSKLASPEERGDFYALVIGINNYRDSNLSKLETAINDANAAADMLRSQFGFKVRVLLDGSHDDIFNALEQFQNILQANDNLLLYYAGHGAHDRNTDKAYWIPVDAQSASRARWIMADDITSEVRAIPARYVLIVSDSCYSGTLNRTLELTTLQSRRALDRIFEQKSRSLMSSGGDEPVADGGAPGHSIFSYGFTRGLGQMDQDRFTATDLFTIVRRIVAGKSAQLPEYKPIRDSGDEGGDFAFFRSTVATNTQPATESPTEPPPPRNPAMKTATADIEKPPVLVPNSGPPPGTVRVNPRDGLNYRWIPPGKFTMGYSGGLEPDRFGFDAEMIHKESPSHEVTITHGF
jgi:hypothetical protein